MEIKANMTDREMLDYLWYWVRVYHEAIEEYDDIRDVLTIRLTNARRTYGSCLNRDSDSSELKFSRYNFFVGNDDQLQQTIVHELIHSIKGLRGGHGSDWKEKAKFYSRKFCMNITRTTTNVAFNRNLNEESKDPKFCVVCSECGRTWYRYRRSRLTDHPESFRCCCGGKLRKVRVKKSRA